MKMWKMGGNTKGEGGGEKERDCGGVDLCDLQKIPRKTKSFALIFLLAVDQSLVILAVQSPVDNHRPTALNRDDNSCPCSCSCNVIVLTGSRNVYTQSKSRLPNSPTMQPDLAPQSLLQMQFP